MILLTIFGKKKLTMPVRIILGIASFVILFFAGFYLNKGANWIFDVSFNKCIVDSILVVDASHYKRENTIEYIIENKSYRVKCEINEYVPYEQKADTVFWVYPIAGNSKKRTESFVLMKYFKENVFQTTLVERDVFGREIDEQESKISTEN